MLVHLRSHHRKAKKFKHPMLDSATPVSEKQATLLVDNYLADRSQENLVQLVMGLRSALRNLVGRFIANWPATKIYTDEMVSEGLLAAVKMVNNLTPEVLEGKNILELGSSRMQSAIERMLYMVDVVAAPAKRTHESRSAAGQPVTVAVVECDLSNVSIPDHRSREEQDLIDAEEAVDVIAKRLQLDADLMKPEFRNLTNEEAAKLLGVSHMTVSRRRAKLRAMYKSEFGVK